MKCQVHLIDMWFEKTSNTFVSKVLCGATHITHGVDMSEYAHDPFQPPSGEEMCVQCTSRLVLHELRRAEL